VLDYRGGIDGQGKLGARFDPPTKTYSLALVPQELLDKAVELAISDTVYQSYLDTQKVLANGDTGHLFSHALLAKQDVHGIAQAISASTALAPWQLIYVEVRLDRGKLTSNSEILSLGHHFRYRWAYTSSIRRKGGKLRACLSPLAGEALEEKKPLERPKLLSGSRLLFGYVHDENNPIGAGVYKRLAGRIAINHALSESEPQFLGEECEGWCIPLPILGQPKPSAWEFYLQQKPGSRLPATYGDLPGDEGGDLAGRKFYRHQPRIKAAKDLGSGAVAETQATLARFICQPQTTFRFTLRFARLRHWELGALLAVLEPQRFGEGCCRVRPQAGLGKAAGNGQCEYQHRQDPSAQRVTDPTRRGSRTQSASPGLPARKAGPGQRRPLAGDSSFRGPGADRLSNARCQGGIHHLPLAHRHPKGIQQAPA
jgi:CRISPR-associated protein (TIGR03986 family)